jgi:hypothetical protein
VVDWVIYSNMREVGMKKGTRVTLRAFVLMNMRKRSLQKR